MKTNDIIYNRTSGKLYQDCIPYISKIFKDEIAAEAYLSQVGLHLRSSAKQSKILDPCKHNLNKHNSKDSNFPSARKIINLAIF